MYKKTIMKQFCDFSSENQNVELFLAGLLARLIDLLPSRFDSGDADSDQCLDKTHSCGDSSRFSRDSLLSHSVALN